ncbi:MAG: hypothetical protein DRJ50_09485, partial [Actinobacteria bacterium]
ARASADLFGVKFDKVVRRRMREDEMMKELNEILAPEPPELPEPAPKPAPKKKMQLVGGS